VVVFEFGLDVFGLPEGEVAAAGGDSQGFSGHFFTALELG
jgi:hypothetical protein